MTFACHVDDVPLGEGRAVTLHGRRIAVFRTARSWFALDAACPHMGGPLADGIVCDHAVTCPLHERRFSLATGDALGGEPGVAAHAVEVRGTGVFVGLAQPAARAA